MKNELRELNIYNLLLVLAYASFLVLRRRMVRLHPSRVFAALAPLQIALLLLFSGDVIGIYYFISGNLAVTALAIIPSTIQRPQYHWVK